MALTKFQRFEMVRMHRRDFQGAPYNPRKISALAKKKLRAFIESPSFGLLAPPTVNKRTMHIVRGHQRITVLDLAEGSDDYELDVAVVNMTEVHEKEANAFLNNPGAQGEYDLDMLADVLKTPGVKFQWTGFETLDIEDMFPDDPELSKIFSNATAPQAVQADIATLEAIADERPTKRKKPKDHGVFDRIDQKVVERENRLDNQLVVIFEAGRAQREAFLRGLVDRGIDATTSEDDKYVKGSVLAAALGIELPPAGQSGSGGNDVDPDQDTESQEG